MNEHLFQPMNEGVIIGCKPEILNEGFNNWTKRFQDKGALASWGGYKNNKERDEADNDWKSKFKRVLSSSIKPINKTEANNNFINSHHSFSLGEKYNRRSINKFFDF